MKSWVINKKSIVTNNNFWREKSNKIEGRKKQKKKPSQHRMSKSIGYSRIEYYNINKTIVIQRNDKNTRLPPPPQPKTELIQ